MSMPATVARIERIIGREAALSLRHAAKAGRVYVPARPMPSDHPVVQAIGIEPDRKSVV